jgi:hypothetical protein
VTDLPTGETMQPTPSAQDVERMMRGQNMRFAVGLAVVLLLVGYTAWLAGGGRAAARDNVTATNASLANNARNACITERRNLQSEAAGDMLRHGLKAQIAGLVEQDGAEARAEISETEAATERWQHATDTLRPEQLNAPIAEGGCGPPILTVSDLPDGDGEH